MFCKFCGQELTPDGKCPGCGRTQEPSQNTYTGSVENQQPYNPPNQKEEKDNEWMPITAFVLGILSLAGLGPLTGVASLILCHYCKKGNITKHQDLAKAGKIISIISIVLFCVMFLFYFGISMITLSELVKMPTATYVPTISNYSALV